MSERTRDTASLEPPCKPLVVGIAGGSGSGKTTFAKRLCSRLGDEIVVIAHDDYYKHLPEMTDEEAAVYDFDSPEALDTDLLIEHLKVLIDGQSVDVPSYDFAAYARTEAARHVEPVRVIVVEGILIMCDSRLRNLFDLIVYMDGDADTRALRRVERDCRERGASLERALQMYFGTAKPAYEKFVEPFRDEADIIIQDAMNDAALDVVVARLSV